MYKVRKGGIFPNGRLDRGKHGRAAPATHHPLLHLHRPSPHLNLIPRRDLKSMHLPLALVAKQPHTLFPLDLGRLVQRLDVCGIRRVGALPRAELVELVVAPEEDVAAPICVVLRELGRSAARRGGHGDGGDVVHDGGGMGCADGHVGEPDGNDGGGGLVIFVEGGEGGEFGGGQLQVRPAAVAELAGQPEAEAPDVGLHAGGIASAGDGLGGFDSEEGRVAAGEDVSDGGLLGGAGVEALGGEEGGRVDEGGFGVEVEA